MVCYIKPVRENLIPYVPQDLNPPLPQTQTWGGIKISPYLVWLLLEAGEAQGEDRTGPGSMTHGLVTFLDAPWGWVWGGCGWELAPLRT